MLANYRWFFRLIAIICITFSILTIFLLPYTGSTYKSLGKKTPKWKRMDIFGVLIAMGAAICFILALTQGPIDGWKSATFIAPFVLAFPLGVGFFVWGRSKFPLQTQAELTIQKNLESRPSRLSCRARSGKSPISSSRLSPYYSPSASGQQASWSIPPTFKKLFTGLRYMSPRRCYPRVSLHSL